MKKAGIIVNSTNTENYEYASYFAEKLIKSGFSVFSCESKVKNSEVLENEEKLFENSDMLITLGGDGTLLRAAVKSAEYNLPIAGINLGRLGFLTAVQKGEEDILIKTLSGDFETEKRIMAKAEILKNGKKIKTLEALNDIVISKGDVLKMIHLKLYINSVFVNDFYSDGLIFATPTGSTAYSLSAGGPVVYPSLNALTVTPVCSHTMTTRPMVIDGSQIVKVTAEISHDEDILLFADGGKRYPIENGDEAIITVSKNSAQFIKVKNVSFYDILNKKLAERK